MELEVGRHLVLNTAHLHCATAELLDAWALLSPNDRPLTIASTAYGWFIPAGEIEGASLARIPSELPPILAFARRHDCTHVLFDCDGPRVLDLPEFPW